MFNTIFTAMQSSSESYITINNFILALGTSFILGIGLSLTYLKTRKDKNLSQSFIITLTILPAIVTVIIMLVGTNIASAFSLAGAFSIIRFRSAPGDPEDITYVLFSMAVGLACGMGYITYAIIVAIALAFIIIILKSIKFGKVNSSEKLLRITIPENLEFQNLFNEILSKYTKEYNLTKMKTSNLGSLYILDYVINLKNDTNEKSLIDELRIYNGNLTIMLMENSKAQEF